jgi:DNA-binding transcriptional LysR family regulator
MLPDIDSLALFVKAAEFRSLTRAADACHIGLAAASRRIGLLEHKLKCTLLERSPKGVELTPAGATLLAHAKQLLVQLNQMQADMDDHAAGRKGRLRILANSSAMTQFVPADLARFSLANPDVRLIIEERWSAQIISAVLAGEADAGVIMEGGSTAGLDTMAYRTDRLAVVVPRGHPLTKLDEVLFSDALDYDFIALETGASLMRLLTEQAVDLGKGLRLRVQVRSFEVVCRMVQAGLGIGLLPFLAANFLSEAMDIEVLALADPWAVRQMLICVKKDRPHNLSLTRLLETLATSQGPPRESPPRGF